ncbi:S41 family peptidase [Pontibacter virosus]|uniref:Peptidase S41-like protein n=1 Tax=Pontibacter virosus TaxID=1765052 RepID=A0A2U1ATU7_9BACT|nr:S41 family peptidase [Pontibacter virosus]PVY39697.1 peptidase S41-like protein [Pontibacter virosus]
MKSFLSKNSIQLLLCLLVLAAPGHLAAQHKPIKFAATDVKADMAYAYETLQKAHYNLFAYVSKSAYDAAYDDLLKSIRKDSLSMLETTMLMQRLLAIGDVGHCEVDFPAASYITYATQGGTVFPLELAFENGKAFVRRSYTSDSSIRAGDQLLQLNGKPIRKIQAAIHPYLSAERPYFKDAKLEFWSFPRYYWAVFGQQEAFKIKVRHASGKRSTHTLKPVTVMGYEASRGGEILRSERSFRLTEEVAYLHPGPFSSPEADGEEQFKAFVDSAFADINAHQARFLILDLRNNAGGHNTYSDYLISYFADKPFRWFSDFTVKTSEVLKQQTRKQYPNAIPDDYTRQILESADGVTFAYAQTMQQPMPEAQRFKGKVYVLVNRQSYSMAAVSGALIQDYGFGEIVGEETGDTPTLYAAQFSFQLPRTSVELKVPKGYIVRPNGDEQLAGLIPDHVVRDHLLDDDDEVLRYTLEKLIEPQRASSAQK